MNRRKLNIGDRITFCAPTRCGKPKATRKVNGFWSDGRPTVRFHGWGDFIVNWHEIVEVQEAS